MLLEYVKSSQVLVLLQSKGVLSRPWVIMELYTAITKGVPIVALNVLNAFSYIHGRFVEAYIAIDSPEWLWTTVETITKTRRCFIVRISPLCVTLQNLKSRRRRRTKN